ncbi:MAG: hypothetical protein H5U16_11005 [Roseovarius sp.]|nr:hypothetical protein [Roseovarius sp.]
MRNLIWIVLALIVLGGGYLLVTGKSVDEVVESVTGSTSGEAPATALEEAEKAAQEAAEAAQEAVGAAVNAAGEAADAAGEAVREGLAPAGEQATAPVGDVPEALTPEGFDLDEARRLIEDSDLGAMQKDRLIAALREVEAAPERLGAALAAVRQALGY